MISQHIVLIGLPGSGKSTMGRQLARRWAIPFVDTDTLIETRLGCSIRDYFSVHGEDAFRDEEERTVAEALADTTPKVIATGGGAVLRPANRKAMNENACVVYLNATPQEIARRLQKDTSRPLLQGSTSPLARLMDLQTIRDPLYREAAHFVVPASGLPASQIVQRIAMQVELAGD